MSRGPLAKINLRSLQHNLQVVRSYAKLQKIYCMVKANAYGHGMIPVAKALKNADGFGVACLQEAALLRQHQIQNPIVLLEGLFSAAEISAAAQYDLELCIHHPRQIAWMEKYQGPKKWIVWLKLNSGMNRLGLDIDKTATWINQIRQLHCISDIRLMSHFACADEIQHPLNQQQLDRFKTYSTGSAYAKSIANSAAILSLPESHFDIVRPGVMLYGVSPFGISDPKYNLKPVMRLSSKIISVHDLDRKSVV